MKNDEQMYQSVLSRRDAYRAEQERKKRGFLRAVPVLACCCLAAVLGLGYRNYLKKLPEIPVVPMNPEASEAELSVTTAPAGTEAVQTVTTAAQSEKTQHTSAKSTETATNVVTVTEADATGSAAAQQTEAQATATAPPAAQTTKPETQTNTVTQTKPVTEPPAVTTEEPGAPEPPARTTEPFIPSETPQKEEPGVRQVQPLWYPDIQAAVNAVRTGDVSGFEPQDRYDYSSMFGRMMRDGYLYQVSNANGITRQDDRGISLLPEAPYEDSGVACRAVYQGKSYYIAFYYADYCYLTMPEYLQRSMNCTSDKDVTVNGETVCLRFADNGRITANAFVERNDGSEVYYTVRGAVSETEMLDFLSAMQYEKTTLYDD